MTRLALLGLIKYLMMTTPFLFMSLMLLALWGIVGKATYTDLNASKLDAGLDAREAKNYLVNETKTIEQCPKDGDSTSVATEEENPMPEKIDWDHVV